MKDDKENRESGDYRRPPFFGAATLAVLVMQITPRN
jgi:hypothetical protein